MHSYTKNKKLSGVYLFIGDTEGSILMAITGNLCYSDNSWIFTVILMAILCA